MPSGSIVPLDEYPIERFLNDFRSYFFATGQIKHRQPRDRPPGVMIFAVTCRRDSSCRRRSSSTHVSEPPAPGLTRREHHFRRVDVTFGVDVTTRVKTHRQHTYTECHAPLSIAELSTTNSRLFRKLMDSGDCAELSIPSIERLRQRNFERINRFHHLRGLRNMAHSPFTPDAHTSR